MIERTFAIIKPDAVKNGTQDKIIQRILQHGLSIVAYREFTFDRELAETFYSIHNDRAFFEGLVFFMMSGPCIGLVLEGEDAVSSWRALMIDIRQEFGTTVTENAVHGSDALVTARGEIKLMFPQVHRNPPHSILRNAMIPCETCKRPRGFGERMMTYDGKVYCDYDCAEEDGEEWATK